MEFQLLGTDENGHILYGVSTDIGSFVIVDNRTLFEVSYKASKKMETEYLKNQFSTFVAAKQACLDWYRSMVLQ